VDKKEFSKWLGKKAAVAITLGQRVVTKARDSKESNMVVSKELKQIQPAKKRRLDPETEYKIFIEATRGDIPQSEVLRKWGLYRSDLNRIKEQVRSGAIKELKARNYRKKQGGQELEELEKEKIIELVVDLFGEKGYAATSIRDISQALNVSIATLYYYFKNKEDLLFTIIEAIGIDLIAILNKAKDEADEPLEGLRNMLSGHINLTQKKKSRVKIYVEEQHNLSKRFRKIIYKQHRKIYDLYVDQLKALQRLRIISSEPLSITAFAIFGMVNWCYRWYKEDGGLNIEDVAQRLIDLLFYGVLNPAEPSFSATKRS